MGGPYVSLGSYRDVIHNHKEEGLLQWRLNWRAPDTISLIDPSEKRTTVFARGRDLGIVCRTESYRGAPRARFLQYLFGDLSFSLNVKDNEKREFELKSEGGYEFKRTQGRRWQLPGPIKSYAFPDQVQTYYQNTGFLAQFVAEFESQMDRIFYLGPLREHPKREYVWTRSRPSDVGAKGEKVVEAILAATDRQEKRNLGPKKHLKHFQEMIAYWLKEMGLVDSFQIKELAPGSGVYQALVKVREGAPEVLLTEVGFGVSQVLPVLTLLYYVEPGSTVILEQPEIHLHPLAQAGLADLIISVSKTRSIQVIVESHSEHFLLRLQRRIAEGEISADWSKLYFCSTVAENSEMVPLEIDEDGRITNWPPKFFGDAFGETAAAQRARLTKTKKAS